MMTQAKRIREIVYQILIDEKQLKYIDSMKTYGIRYTELKNKLLEYSFTEGAVIGALNTITKNIEQVEKIKAKEGTFYVYDRKNSNENGEKFTLQDSVEYGKIYNSIYQLQETNAKILKDIAKNNFDNITSLDIEFFRKITKLVDELKINLNEYQLEKGFEHLKRGSYSDE